MTKYRQDAKTGKLVEIVKQPRKHQALIQGKMEPFVSIVDGSVISTQKELRDHNKRNNVTQDSFSGAIAARTAARENLFGGRYKDPERKADIRDAIERCRSEGDNRYRY